MSMPKVSYTCPQCGNDKFNGHKLFRADCIVNGLGTFEEKGEIYDVENLCGPFGCTKCGFSFDEFSDLEIHTVWTRNKFPIKQMLYDDVLGVICQSGFDFEDVFEEVRLSESDANGLTAYIRAFNHVVENPFNVGITVNFLTCAEGVNLEVRVESRCGDIIHDETFFKGESNEWIPVDQAIDFQLRVNMLRATLKTLPRKILEYLEEKTEIVCRFYLVITSTGEYIRDDNGNVTGHFLMDEAYDHLVREHEKYLGEPGFTPHYDGIHVILQTVTSVNQNITAREIEKRKTVVK